MTAIRKKLIEHSLPLDAINAASSREKSVRHGHPSTLHLWWARRPLAACRAVIFAQLVDDPSAWPEKFKTEEDQDRERRRLHGVIENMVEWPKSDAKDQTRFKSAIEAARWEIARSVAWGRGEEPPARSDDKAVLAYLQEYAPPVYDPFCGGGSIPLEAQRLGLLAKGSDINPVSALISKSLVDFPARFDGAPSVCPERQGQGLIAESWDGARGLASDIRYYGSRVRDKAHELLAGMYPLSIGENGNELRTVAWLWARTVASPDPAQNGRHTPLMSTQIISSKPGREVIARPTLDPHSTDGWTFKLVSGPHTKDALAKAKSGTQAGRGANFTCAFSGAAISPDYLKAEALSGNLRSRLIARVAEGTSGRVYLEPTAEHEAASSVPRPELPEIEQKLPDDPRNFWVANYGLDSFDKLFSPRQLIALSTFSDLIKSVEEEVMGDASRSSYWCQRTDPISLEDGGAGARAYSQAISIYLGFALSKLADRGSTLCSWFTARDSTRPTFARQSLAMVWDYAELNTLMEGTGSFLGAVNWTAESIEGWQSGGACGQIELITAQNVKSAAISPIISTDPPYYDNIGYADLSDFFYVWLRRTLKGTYSELFRRSLTPKLDELVASPYRHGGRKSAERHFMSGMRDAIQAFRSMSDQDFPLAVYYAFKQSEVSKDGILSPGWAAFLQAVVDAGLQIDGTWPIRTELSNRMIASGTNALAASVVLVCRPRAATAGAINRRDFLRELRPAMQQAILDHQKAGIPLPDRRQAAIGPGIGVFSKYAMIRESDDSPMSVATALALINREIDAILTEGTEDLDAETRFALEWYQQFGYGFQKGRAGDAIQQLQGFNLDINSLNASGLFHARQGDAKLLSRGEMEDGWTPSKDATFTLWEMAQHLARALTAEDGGLAKCGQLLAEKPTAAADVLLIAERMFEMATTRGENDEALVWNQLQTSWPGIETAADEANERGYSPAPEQSNLF